MNLGCKKVTQVYTGEEAIQKVQELGPDLIIININLNGEMMGVETSHQIIDLYNIPIIFLTVFIKNCLNKSLQIPEDSVVLSEPLTMEKVKYSIKRALNH